MRAALRYHFAILALAFLAIVFLLNDALADKVFFIYLAVTAFCLVIRLNKTHGVILSNTVAAFVVLQVFLPDSLFDVNYKTLQPNLSTNIEIETNGLLGSLDDEIFISTDERGFRSHHSKAAYDKRIFLIGGSTTEQLTISDEKTTASVLEDLLVDAGTKVNVVNTGLSGLRAIHHAATIRHTTGDDAIGYIILVGVNDWNHVLRNGDSVWRLRLRRPTDWPLTLAVRGLRARLAGDARAETVERNMESPNAFYGRMMNLYPGKPKIDFQTTAAHRKYYAAEIERIEAACEGLPDGQFCIFATQPHGYTPSNFADDKYVQTLWMTPPDTDWALTPSSLISVSNEFNKWLNDAVDCRNCYVLPLDEVFNGDKAYFYDDVHLNNDGARLFAESAFRFLSEHKLLEF